MTTTFDGLFDGSDAHLISLNNAEVMAAWNEIMSIATRHALIVAAVDGIATLALPVAQVEAGWYERCQYNHMLGDHPKTLQRAREGKS